ncbi:teichoic acids export ATP-binding protein TagH [Clostridium tepidiprofundi DSM 19306]|uniref:Teichoic acids export ATP-binding protein TagH n=1 Tax=Clostridium tepidiprofundi DSM 19306 TaxID=1121338 RepID=A0A151B3H8_9CLOT|nr:ABC transporter ATP-binding protein [Clostridium tepidiprofundi]KYH34465.1 teichoic acids export ATP-binding protein TagH [Clostridium tepidiprofundi DSM 19306]
MKTTNIVVEARDISKVYKLYDKPIDRLKESLHPFSKKYHREFYALKNISFKVKRGETVGIIGKNGSGKSTLLKIVTGVLTPSYGEVEVEGRISALLELGAGFNPEYTGIENIYLNGTIMGYSREQMDEKLNDILEFADIGDYVYQPVKYYSSGMFVRLAFAVAINVDPDILIVDEALSVGDIRFQQKCYRKIDEFKQNKTVLFVSHDMGAINKYCDRVIWIDEGKILDEGKPKEISKKYRAFMMNSKLKKNEEAIDYCKCNYKEDKSNNIQLNRLDKDVEICGDGKAHILGIGLFDSKTYEKLQQVYPGQKIKMIIRYKLNYDIDNIIVGFTIKDRLGNIVTQSNNYILNKKLSYTDADNFIISACFEFTLPNIRAGNYTISPAIASGTQMEHTQHCWAHDAIVFQVPSIQKYDLEGFMFLEPIEFSLVK